MIKSNLSILKLTIFVVINLYPLESDCADYRRNLASFAEIVIDIEAHPYFEYLVKKVKEDLGIEEDVRIYWFWGRKDFKAQYHFNNHFIAISDLIIDEACPALRRFVLAHELEHYKQFKRYTGSYKNFERDRDKKAFWLALEQGADAAAAGYIECETCLKKIAKVHKANHHNTHTDCGDFTSEKGYFTEKDFELYIQRARDEKCICRACWKGINCKNYFVITNQDYCELVKQDLTLQERFELCNN